MLQANELRIGATFINNSDGLFEDGEYVTLDRHHFYWAFESSENLEDLLEPISLTPEILKKCGFEKQRDSDYLFENKHIQIAKVDEGFEMFTSDYSAHESHSSRTMKYLHELQNLHFSWVGEELEIKELQHA